MAAVILKPGDSSSRCRRDSSRAGKRSDACDDWRGGADHRRHNHLRKREHVDGLCSDAAVAWIEGSSDHSVSDINRRRRRQVVEQTSVSRPERVTRRSINTDPRRFACCVIAVEARDEHRGKSTWGRGIERQPLGIGRETGIRQAAIAGREQPRPPLPGEMRRSRKTERERSSTSGLQVELEIEVAFSRQGINRSRRPPILIVT